jgi:DNA-binding MarR family transcriptional regulator
VRDDVVMVRTLARLARVLEHSCTGLSLAQYRVLALVVAGDERASLLAERLAVAPPTITAVVDGLVDAGHLTRTAAAGDRRATQIGITPAGRAAVADAEAAMGARLAPLVDALAEPDAFVDACRQVGAALDAKLATRRPASPAAPASTKVAG